MKRTIVAILCAAALGASGTAIAQQTETQTPDQTVFQRKTVVEFTPTDVFGKVVGPNIEVVRTRGRARFKSLIQIRSNFVAEVLNSANAL